MMEATIRKLFSFFYFVAAFPFKIQWEPGLQSNLILKRFSPNHILWLLWCCIFFVNFPVVVFFLLIRTPDYLARKHFEKLAFHGLWTVFACCFINQQWPYLNSSHEVRQLANGMVELRKNLNRGK